MKKERQIKRSRGIKRPMSAFILKIIAIFSMTCDHFSYLIFHKFSFLNYIGRLAFPIFAYQITEGYIHTHNLKKYFFRLFVFALISQIPFMLFIQTFSSGLHLNVLFTLFLGLLAILIYDKLNAFKYDKKWRHLVYKFSGILIAFLIAGFAGLIKTDYGYFGVLVIFSFFIFKDHKILSNLSFIFLVFVYYGKYLINPAFSHIYLYIVIFTISSLIFINLYNHEKGRNTKYFLYIFYPTHLLIIYLLNFLFTKL